MLASQEWRAMLAPQEWRALLTAQEWRAYWDKWLLLARAAPHAVHEHDEPPPQYTPRAEDAVEVRGAKGKGKERARVEEAQVADAPAPVAGPSVPERATRRAVYQETRPVSQHEVGAYGYRPNRAQGAQIPQKGASRFTFEYRVGMLTARAHAEDRMLLLFWIPILMLALIWVFVHGVRLAMHYGMRSVAPLRALVSV
jgi:hypothetical protein